MRFSFVLAALAVSTVGFAQDRAFQVAYAANLNIGDSVVNISNDGVNGGVFGVTPASLGNICANLYVFDPQEEEIGCCSCLVTPNGLNSLSVKNDLISNNLTPAVPTSITLTLVGSAPNFDASGAYTVCNPATVRTGSITVPTGLPVSSVPLNLRAGLAAWGTTLEPSATPGTYSPVRVPFLNTSNLDPNMVITTTPGANPNTTTVNYIPSPGDELTGLTQLCNFIQSNGTGYGICKSCRLGALGGLKQ